MVRSGHKIGDDVPEARKIAKSRATNKPIKDREK